MDCGLTDMRVRICVGSFKDCRYEPSSVRYTQEIHGRKTRFDCIKIRKRRIIRPYFHLRQILDSIS